MASLSRVTYWVLLCALSAHCNSQETISRFHWVRFVAPAYPALARTGRMQGKVTANIHINGDASVASTTITMAHPVFHQYVEKALSQWKFEPVGEPATLDVVVDFKFDECRHVKSDAELRETKVMADLPNHLEIVTCTNYITASTN